jgi:hypothetical protein
MNCGSEVENEIDGYEIPLNKGLGRALELSITLEMKYPLQDTPNT